MKIDSVSLQIDNDVVSKEEVVSGAFCVSRWGRLDSSIVKRVLDSR